MHAQCCFVEQLADQLLCLVPLALLTCCIPINPCRFMRFMERYAEDKGLGFQKSG